MTNKFAISDNFINSKKPLSPKNAVGAIMVNENNEVLLQLRDDLDYIFFPHHWGCFGGAIEPDETPEQALIRELQEEVGIDFSSAKIEEFITINFNPKPKSKEMLIRQYYIVKVDKECIKRIQLGEGNCWQIFGMTEVLKIPNISPYDRFGLWLYYNQARLTE